MASLAMMAACSDTGSRAGEDERSAETASPHSTSIDNRDLNDENSSILPPAISTGACQTQDGGGLPRKRLRAVGTEPFWGAEVDGRCVTYSTPENQSGTRVWTHFDAAANQWEGVLDDKSFKLTIEAHEGCSDGMSDRSFPFVAIVKVGGEERRGCAEPL